MHENIKQVQAVHIGEGLEEFVGVAIVQLIHHLAQPLLAALQEAQPQLLQARQYEASENDYASFSLLHQLLLKRLCWSLLIAADVRRLVAQHSMSQAQTAIRLKLAQGDNSFGTHTKPR